MGILMDLEKPFLPVFLFTKICYNYISFAPCAATSFFLRLSGKERILFKGPVVMISGLYQDNLEN